VTPHSRSADRHLRVLENPLRGGAAERLGVTERDVSPTELHLGQRHEMEHTDDPSVARQIALDHLAEDPRYYSELIRLKSTTKGPRRRIMNAADILRGLRR